MSAPTTTQSKPPAGLKNLTIENITENVHAINSQTPNPRLKYLLERLVTHLHDFARETRLSSHEWMTALLFLTAVGQISTEVRQEFILLSDILGLSLLVDSIDHPKPPNSTQGTVLGPFHTHEAEHASHGGLISQDPAGEPLLVLCTLKDVNGNAIPNASIDVWETDSKGFYDVQHADRSGPDGRAVLTSDEKGDFWFKAIVPVPYPIPHDGPVGKLLKQLNRHPYRPSHMHFMFKKDGYDPLVTLVPTFPLRDCHVAVHANLYPGFQCSLPQRRPIRDNRCGFRRERLVGGGTEEGRRRRTGREVRGESRDCSAGV
jgi:protocatechuate 3,4-dioxygenase beta subunit